MDKMIASFDGTELFLNVDAAESPKAVAIIVHGLAEHQGRYDYVAKKLNEAGISTWRFDHRGHGRSEGERAFYNDYDEMLSDVNLVVDMAIADNPLLPAFLIGHSMGGFAVALYGAKYTDKKLAGIVSSGALTHDTPGSIHSIPAGLDVHTAVPNELGDGVCSVREVVEAYVADPLNCKAYTIGLIYALQNGIDWFADAKAAFAYPVLMLHGEKDALVSVEDTYKFFGGVASADKQLKVYGGLFHEIFNETIKDEVIDDVIAWIGRRV